MAEIRIEIEIDENGKILAKTDGLKGETCLEELELLLGEADVLQEVTKTDEYYQSQSTKVKKTIKNKKR
jgi:hypothetical protein